MQQHLTAARRKRGWSINTLAKRSGVNKSTISRLERGENDPLCGTAKKLEIALGLKRGTLAFDSEPRALAS